MDIRAVIFDLDGTIADTIPLTIYSIREVVREFTGKVLSDEDILKEFGPIDTEIVKRFIDDEGKKGLAAEAYIKHFDENFHSFVKPIEGIKELLCFLKDIRIKVGLFTGRSLRAAEIVLKNLGAEKYFEVIIPGDFTKLPKPDPEGINMALDRLSVKNTQSIYVGDFDVDIKASRAAGTLAVLALWSSTGSEKLLDLNPDKFFRSPHEFIEWMKGSIA